MENYEKSRSVITPSSGNNDYFQWKDDTKILRSVENIRHINVQLELPLIIIADIKRERATVYKY